MGLEVLKSKLLKALTPSEKRVRQSNINDVESDPDPVKSRHYEDEHRKAAMGQVDILLESGLVTPEEAEKMKAKWDIMHGY
jgi:uncharacterized protein YjcR